MSKLRVHIAVSADGYVAGPNQSKENPLGEGGESLHDWAFPLKAFREHHGREGGEENASTPVLEEALANVGAEIMGRGKFGGGPGPWGDDPWPGWWGEDPPFHMPVFVLTHHGREPLMLSDTTFTFVTDGIEPALEQAREAAAGKDVTVGGGADVINQYLAAGLVDELELHIVPLVLGGGARLFEGVDPDLTLEQVRAVAAPGVTHLKYRLASDEVARV
jgi:dihydrofolate reductase